MQLLSVIDSALQDMNLTQGKFKSHNCIVPTSSLKKIAYEKD